MTARELIAELEKWPDCEVRCSRHFTAPGSAPSFAILSVEGYAGARMDGKDSGLSIRYDGSKQDLS